MSNRTLMLILFPIMAIVVAALIFGNYMAMTWNTIISRFFNHQTYRIEKIDDSVQIDDQYYKSDFSDEAALTEHNAEVAERIEAEGMVLLKNEGSALPLSTSADNKAKVSLFSVSSVDMVYGGTGSGSIDTSTAPTLRNVLEGVNFEVNGTLWDYYRSQHDAGYDRSSPNWRGGQFEIKEVPWANVQAAAGSTFSEYNDAAIVVIARSGGEGSDLTAQNFAETENVAGNSGSYLELSTEEADMLEAVTASFEKVIVLVNANNALELGWLDEYDIDAALWIGGVGQTGLYAVADALVGEVVPSGRLVDTYAYAYDANSAPAAQNAGSNFWIENKPSSAAWVNESDQYAVYAEGIYVGYRYYETRYEDVVLGRANTGDYDYNATVQYPFGYGLSYTTFSYSDFSAEADGDTFTVSLSVTNTGGRPGKDVVQIYGQSEYTQYDIDNKVEKSAVELMGFDKTDVLDPGESETVTINVEKEQFASYDYTNAKTYILDAGTHYLAFGTNAHDALNNILAAKGKTVSDGMTAAGDADMAYAWTQTSRDTDTYSEDSTTGTPIVNRFDSADIRNYTDGSNFNYLTRNNWTGTFPTAFADRTDEKGERYKTFSQTIIDGFAPNYVEDKDAYTMPEVAEKIEEGLNLATLIGVEYDSEAWEDFLNALTPEAMLYTVRMGGYGNPENAELNIPATTAKDGPAGISATLIGGTQGMAYPTEVVVASTWNVELAEEMGIAVGNDAMFADVQAWYAPAMNTHRTAYGGRNFEYYSEDGFLSGKIGANVVKGAESKGLYCYVKHFAVNDGEGAIDYDGYERNVTVPWAAKPVATGVQFPFGYGIGYTTFSKEIVPDGTTPAGTAFTDGNKDATVRIDVKVTNTGNAAGKEVVQLYCTRPYEDGGIEKPYVELIAFGKTELLEPGASETVTLSFSLSDMKSFDNFNANGNAFYGYELEKGTYLLRVLDNAHDWVNVDENSPLCLAYEVAEDILYPEDTETGNAVARRFAAYADGREYLSRADGFANASVNLEANLHDYEYDLPEIDDGAFSYERGKDYEVELSDPIMFEEMRDVAYEDEKWNEFISQLSKTEMATLIAMGNFQTTAVERLGIPKTLLFDGPAAIKDTYKSDVGCLLYPSEVSVAATWSKDVGYAMGASAGDDAKQCGVTGWYAPGVNLHTNAYGSRNFEYYSECPLLSGEMAASVSRGAWSQGVIVFVKHLIDGASETLNEQSMREIYARPFEIAIKKGDVHGLMTSDDVLGTWIGQVKEFITDIVRGEWGFCGMITSDAASAKMQVTYGIRAGNDIWLATDNARYTTLVREEKDIAAMQQCCKNILYTISRSDITFSSQIVDAGWSPSMLIMGLVDGISGSIVLITLFFLVRHIISVRKVNAIVIKDIE